MSLLLETLPLLTFFIAYRLGGFYVATYTTLVLGLCQAIVYWIKRKPMSIFQSLGLLWLTLLGGATLIFQNVWFLKWKPTLFYGSLALACMLSVYLKRTPPIQHALKAHIQLPNAVWQTLNWHCTLFFISISLLNLSVAYTFDTDTWVYFKLFGLPSLILSFTIGQLLYLSRFIKSNSS